MKNFITASLLSLFFLNFCHFGLMAQVTTQPYPLQEDSEDVTIYFHADQGNKGLAGLDANTKIYAHTGLITSASKNNSDWKYTIADWNKDTEKALMIYEGPNLWSLHIGNIRQFYGVKDMQEVIEKLAFVFRTSGGSKEGKTASGGDIYVDVLNPGLQVSLTSTLTSQLLDSSTGNVTFTAYTTSQADISITVNGVEIASQKGATTLSGSYLFKNIGDYQVVATAVSGSETASYILNLAYLSEPVSKAYPNGTPIMGPVENPDGSVTFCVAAPEMSKMVIVGSWNDYMITNDQQMFYTDQNVTNPVTNESGNFRFFWITIPDLAKTNDQHVYFFKVQGDVSVGANQISINTNICDPYARLVLDPWNDKYIDTDVYPGLPQYPFSAVDAVPVAIYQKGLNDYKWQSTNFTLPDKDNLIIYELLLRDFTGTEGENNGNGTVQQAIEKFDYLKTLGVNVIELMPICDFTGNDSWGYNPNFYFAPDKAYGTPDDYKEFIDLCHQNGIAVVLDMVFNQSDGLHPWYQMYGGNQYSPFYNYGLGGENGAPHAYSVMNDWNQGYPLVQHQWKDVIEYWLSEYNVDGFRFDLVKGLGLNQSYANSSGSATDAYNESRVKEMAYLNSVIQNIKPGAYCINENLAQPKEENEMAADGELNWANINSAACQFAKGLSSESNLNRLYAPLDNRTWGSTVSYLESHDEERLAYQQDKYGQTGVKGNNEVSMRRLGSAAAQMLMAPGSHLIWMFGELGKSESLEDRTGRKKVEWNLYNLPNHRGLYDNYSQLINIRISNPELFSEQTNFAMNCGSNYWAKGRTMSSITGDKELYTIINPNITGQISVSVNFLKKDNSAYKILSQSYLCNASFDAIAGTVTLPANCYVVIGSASLNVAGIDSIFEEKEESKFVARGAKGEIIFENYHQPVEIYSLDGTIFAQNFREMRISLPAGIYIVRCGANVAKVIVK
ncbi:MAG: hypothetical protein J1F38_00415 [Muribaculaceae bacterium]|nr:hypothetical protein [Muribaculaceae bacterium]